MRQEPDELVPEPPLSRMSVFEDPLVPEEVEVLAELVELVPLDELVGTVYEISLE